MTFVDKKVKEYLQKVFHLPAPKVGFQMYDGREGRTVQVNEFVDDGKYEIKHDQDELDQQRHLDEGGVDPEEVKAVRLRVLKEKLLDQKNKGKIQTLKRSRIIRP
jgi:hypothetical protein